jgi:hypothetical protein
MRGMLILGLVIVLWNSCADRQMRAAQQRTLAPVELGMTAREVRTRWGTPEGISQTMTTQGRLEQWRYRNGSNVEVVGHHSVVMAGRYVQLLFLDGQVVAISERAVTYQKRLERSPLDSKVPLSSVAPTTATPMGARSMAGWCSS